MTPAPLLFAAALGERLPRAQIAILGTDLPLHNPINIAEQYATLDNLLGRQAAVRPAARHAERVHDLRDEPVGVREGSRRQSS